MTGKDKKPNKIGKRERELIQRFRIAYERLNRAQRRDCQAKFCEIHSITPGAFRNKMNGFSPLYEAETEWLENYDPYRAATPAAELA